MASTYKSSGVGDVRQFSETFRNLQDIERCRGVMMMRRMRRMMMMRRRRFVIYHTALTFRKMAPDTLSLRERFSEYF